MRLFSILLLAGIYTFNFHMNINIFKFQNSLCFHYIKTFIPECESCSIPRPQRPLGDTFNRYLNNFLEETPSQICSKG